ncbi:MAG: hypothetical protein P4M11_15455 [Candidatus Pacebacteria bacterium]|nr:hypothetical protein [Candidatus Paceibacterota bacterium]
MPAEHAGDTFQRCVCKYTLIFRNPQEELNYQITAGQGVNSPRLATVFAYLCLGSHIIYRVLALLSNYVNVGMAGASPPVELTLLLLLLLVYLIETLLRHFNTMVHVHGLLLYTTLPIVVVTAAFYP